MAKRKRTTKSEAPSANTHDGSKKAKVARPAEDAATTKSVPVTVQIVTGSYDRILHGMAAKMDTEHDVEFTDTFLLEPHTSSIRCVAISPPSAPVPGQEQKVILASGSNDEQIKLYHLSAHPPTKAVLPAMPSFARKAAVENPHNRQLGSLLHHSGPVTALQFPTRSKLLSAAEDCTIAVTRSRDWSLLSTIKAPAPKAHGRPSGDTAPAGATPAGVNDFAIHPSMKLMISVGRGEKCMRLWNLVTGKKAGVLTFDRPLLNAVGEGRFSSGEGRRACWGSSTAGEEFAVVFERGVAVFGMNSKPRCIAVPDPKTKLHQVCYVSGGDDDEPSILALSTEDGRILFYSTQPDDLSAATPTDKEVVFPSAKLVAQLGGTEAGISGRVKDFVALQPTERPGVYVIVTASSDGSIRLWTLPAADLRGSKKVRQTGTLRGTYKTDYRITCLKAFVMVPRPDGLEELEDLDAASSSEDSDSE